MQVMNQLPTSTTLYISYTCTNGKKASQTYQHKFGQVDDENVKE